MRESDRNLDASLRHFPRANTNGSDPSRAEPIRSARLSFKVGRPPIVGLVARQFWGWSPASFGVGRPPVVGLVARQFCEIAVAAVGSCNSRDFGSCGHNHATTTAAVAAAAIARAMDKVAAAAVVVYVVVGIDTSCFQAP